MVLGWDALFDVGQNIKWWQYNPSVTVLHWFYGWKLFQIHHSGIHCCLFLLIWMIIHCTYFAHGGRLNITMSKIQYLERPSLHRNGLGLPLVCLLPTDFTHIRQGNFTATGITMQVPQFLQCNPGKSMVSCQKGPTHHAYAWQIGPFCQDTVEIWVN